MAISATEKPLSRVFMSDYRFTIPSFQRAYTWQAENILQLVCDLQDASASANTPYFLGSLILVRNGDCKYQVIDGQQRLISLSIIIAVLRELETDPVLLEELDELILEPGNKLRGITEPRLRLRDRDAEFFRSYVQEGDLEGLFDLREGDFETRAQYNISTNARQVFDELAKLDDDDRHRFASYLVNQVTLVIVTTDDLAGAHRIFDVMNMRGVPLTASDVFKAKAIAAMSPAARNVYAARWDDIMDPIGDDAQVLEEFFTDLHLIVSHKAVCTQLLEEFRTDVLMPYVREQNVISFVDELLAPYAMAWRILDHPTDSLLPAAIVRQLVLLNDYPTGDWKPVAMWALTHSIGNLADAGVKVFTDNARNNATKSDGTGKDREPLRLHDETRLRAILSALERVTGVDALNRQSSLARRTRAASAVRYLDRGYTMPQNRGFLITDDERRSALAHLRGELQTNARMNRLLLIRANEQLAGGRITRPRSLNAMPILPDRVAKDSPFAAWPESVRDFWSARIGNLALTQANEQQLTPLQTFKERRDRMLMSASSKRFPLTEQLAHIDDCTAKTLQWRQDETIRLIAEFWNIRYDEGNTDLSVLDEQQLTHGSSSRTPNAKRVTIAQVLASGLLIAGETLVWERPRKGERWVATVTDDGRLRLEDGNEYSSPTAAARAVGGASAGLSVWKRTSDGCKLSEIWKTYRMQKR